jgi:hypothetical protein
LGGDEYVLIVIAITDFVIILFLRGFAKPFLMKYFG